mmetsp:Transcript_14733/g.40665  ORF Transcript_14733/g.40665 Transcript_14733/m.40665 type:complete len:187 (-) Transcript_14733:278-838(-)
MSLGKLCNLWLICSNWARTSVALSYSVAGLALCGCSTCAHGGFAGGAFNVGIEDIAGDVLGTTSTETGRALAEWARVAGIADIVAWVEGAELCTEGRWQLVTLPKLCVLGTLVERETRIGCAGVAGVQAGLTGSAHGRRRQFELHLCGGGLRLVYLLVCGRCPRCIPTSGGTHAERWLCGGLTTVE